MASKPQNMIDYRYWSLKRKVATVIAAGFCLLALLYVRGDYKERTRYGGKDFAQRVDKFNDTIKTLEEKVGVTIRFDNPLKDSLEKAREEMRAAFKKDLKPGQKGADLETSLRKLREDYDAFHPYVSSVPDENEAPIDAAFTAVEAATARAVAEAEKPVSTGPLPKVSGGIPMSGKPLDVAVSTAGGSAMLDNFTADDEMRRRQEQMLAAWPQPISAAENLLSLELLSALADDPRLHSALDAFRSDVKKALGTGPTAPDETSPQVIAGLKEDLKTLSGNALEAGREARIAISNDYRDLHAAYLHTALSGSEQRFLKAKEVLSAQNRLTTKAFNRLLVENTAETLYLMREAMTAWRQENGNLCPPTLLALSPRYFAALPQLSLPGYAPNNTLSIMDKDPKPDTLPPARDSGGWLYIADPASARCGTLLIDSARKNPKGKLWLSM